MEDTLITAHVVNACARCASKETIVKLWRADGFDDPTHIMRIDALTRIFDIVIGGFAEIAGARWQLFEQKCADQVGVYIYLRKVEADGMVIANRPRTKQEWQEWQAQKLAANGVKLRPSPEPYTYPQARPQYSAGFDGALEAEA